MRGPGRVALGGIVALGTYASNGASEPATSSVQPSTALAESTPVHEEQKRTPLLALRLTGGAGGGNIGFGMRGGVAGEVWITDSLGLGVLGGKLFQDDLKTSTGQQDSSGCSAVFISPVLAGRLSAGEGYFLGTVGGGYYAAECYPHAKTQGVGFNASAGFLFRPVGIFEIGPVLRVDVVPAASSLSSFDTLVTLDLELGFAVPKN